MVVQGASTAIRRKGPPAPLRWLLEKGLLVGRSLDYGSGRQCWLGMVCYDPHWRPVPPAGQFDTISCNYVLNVVSPATQREILVKIYALLRPGGNAYIAVRRDLAVTGEQGRKTFQRYVVLKLPSIKKNSGYEIYRLHKKG